MSKIRAQEIWLHGVRYFLFEEGSIVAEDWHGEIGYAHLNDDGSVMRYGKQIARISDIEFGNTVELEVGIDTLTGMIDTILGDE